jgi:hypothetical protein
LRERPRLNDSAGEIPPGRFQKEIGTGSTLERAVVSLQAMRMQLLEHVVHRQALLQRAHAQRGRLALARKRHGLLVDPEAGQVTVLDSFIADDCGKAFNPAVKIELAAEAADIVAQDVESMSDPRGSADYRRDMLRVVTRRTIEARFGLCKDRT